MALDSRNRRGRHLAAALTLTLAAFGVLAAPALAGNTTVSRVGNVVTVTASPGDANRIIVSTSGGNLIVSETGTGVTLVDGGGCPVAANQANCGAAAGVTNVNGATGDQSDSFDADSVSIPTAADGGTGSDTLTSGGAKDQLNGGPGNDFLVASGDNDGLDGGPGRDNIFGGSGDDGLVGGDGDDTVSDGSGTNSLDGGEGDDSISGGTGTDTMNGGPGDDGFGFFSTDVVGADVVDGGPGVDNVGFSNVGEPLSLSLDGQPNDGRAGQGMNLLNLENLSGGTAADIITGDDGPNDLNGNSGEDTIDGRGGNDLLFAGTGDDGVTAGDGDDQIFGNSGNDALNGGEGTDQVYGQDGADDMTGGGGNDTVLFFLSSTETGVAVTLDDQPNDGRPGEGDNAHADIENIEGSNGPDTLVGRAGVNAIKGLGGNDTIVTRDGNRKTASPDVADCGEGADVVLADVADVIGDECESPQLDAALAVVTLASSRAKRGRVTLQVICPPNASGGCFGTIGFSASGVKKAASKLTYALAPGGSADAIVTLSRAAQSRLRSKGKLSVTAALREVDRSGLPRTGTAKLAVKR